MVSFPTRQVLLLLVSLTIVSGQTVDSTTQMSDASTTTTLAVVSTPTSLPSSTSSVSSTSTTSTTSTSSTLPTTTSTATTTTTTTSIAATTTLAASSPTTTSSTTTASSASSTTTASSATSSTAAAASSSSSSVSPSTSTSSSTSAVSPSTTKSSSTVQPTSTVTFAPVSNVVKLTPDNNPNDARVAAAVAGGCGLFLLNTVFFVIVSVLLRYSSRMERHKIPKTGRRSLTGGGLGFYGGQEVQSAQALFAPSLSATNIVSGASDIQLDMRGGRGVYVNRGFDGSQAAIGSDNGLPSPGYESGYRPIEIKSQGAAGSSRA